LEDGVHGDIRHLENTSTITTNNACVHGDIRHLEKDDWHPRNQADVHGDIRHLETIRLV